MADAQSDLRTIVNQDGAVILNTTTGGITTLNSTGALIWQALERGEALETIAANLACETGEQMDSLKRDVREFMNVLKEQKLLSS
jgi:predicted Rdx family selenoprotein